MPGRLTPLVNGEYYHIFNRGSDKRNIFAQQRDYARFQQAFYYYQFIGPKPKFSNFSKYKLRTFKPSQDSKRVEILSYCLMPNHFHFLVQQLKENGIAGFISQLANSYTKYFNTKYKRVGALLQGSFKSVHVENDEQLIHLSRYIHLNPIVSNITNNLDGYPWSSYSEYAYDKESLCSTKEVLNLFPSKNEYKTFLMDQIDYAKSLNFLKHQLIDVED